MSAPYDPDDPFDPLIKCFSCTFSTVPEERMSHPNEQSWTFCVRCWIRIQNSEAHTDDSSSSDDEVSEIEKFF